MRTLQTCSTAAAIAAALVAAGAMPSNAAPPMLPQAAVATSQSEVILVRDGVRWRRGWYNGYRGYPRYRAGYHYHGGWWYPAGAFVAGALIGGAIANSNYYGDRYYADRYYGGGYYPRYYEPAPVYHPSGSSYRAGYREGYRDGYYARRYRNDITCTQRLESAGKC